MSIDRTYNLTPVPVRWRVARREAVMLLVQPRTRYASPPTRGFRHEHDDQYVRSLTTALQEMRGAEANFVVFPEYAWPFDARGTLLKTANDHLPENSVCIAPFEHVDHDEFRKLLTDLPVPTHIRVAELADVEQRVEAAPTSVVKLTVR